MSPSSFVNAAFLKRRANQWRVRYPSLTTLADAAGAVQWPHVSITRTTLGLVPDSFRTRLLSLYTNSNNLFLLKASFLYAKCQKWFLTKHNVTEITFILNSHTSTPYTYTYAVHVHVQVHVKPKKGTLHVALCDFLLLAEHRASLEEKAWSAIWKTQISGGATNCSAVPSLSESRLDIPSGTFNPSFLSSKFREMFCTWGHVVSSWKEKKFGKIPLFNGMAFHTRHDNLTAVIITLSITGIIIAL